METPSQEIRTFDDLMEWLNPIGRWQIWIYAWMAYAQFFSAAINVAVVFFQITPDFECVLPADVKMNDWTTQQIWNLSFSNNDELNKCYRKTLNLSKLESLTFEEAWSLSNKTAQTESCETWKFDRSANTMKNTIVTQFSLVCSRGWYVATAQAVYMVGFLIGVFLAGSLGDRFGRKPVFVLSGIAVATMGILQAKAGSLVLFMVFRFFLSLTSHMCGITSFVLCLEATTTRLRIWVGGLFYIPYAFGYTALAGIAYGLRDWRDMHVAISVPLYGLVAYWWLIPESPRWLLSAGRIKEAETILLHAAQINGKSSTLPVSLDKLNQALHIAKVSEYWKIFKNKTLATRAVNVYFNWFVNALVYYGVSLNVASFLQGNVFVTNGVSGAVEIPGVLICVPLLYWGRKKSLMATLLLAGVVLLVVPLVPEGAWRILTVMIGKLCVTASFSIIYVFTLEVYPTTIRSNGMAISSMVGRLGSIIAPFISQISQQNYKLRAVPMVIFGGFATVAGILVYFLPETKGKPTPEFINDAIHLYERCYTSYRISCIIAIFSRNMGIFMGEPYYLPFIWHSTMLENAHRNSNAAQYPEIGNINESVTEAETRTNAKETKI